MKKDLLKYYLFSFFLGLYIANGTTVLFERVLQFSYSQVFTLGAVYMLMFILFEVPSGAFADLVGRKKSVALGCLLLVLGSLASGLSNNFWQLFASFFLWAAGFSCISGASQALLYDRLNNEEQYGKVLGTSALIGLVGTILAGIVGPYLYDIHFRLPYFASAIPFLAAGIAILFFTEHKHEGKFTFAHHLAQMKQGGKAAFNNKFIRWSMFVLALTFAAMYTMSNAFQPYLQDIGFSVRAFSFILPVMFLFQGLGGFVSERLYKKLGENPLFWVTLTTLGMSIGFLGIVPLKASVAALVLYTFLQGVASPLLSVYANRHIASHQRATVMSVQSMISTIAAALPLFLFGFLTDRFGLNMLLVILGASILVIGIFLLIVKPRTA